MAYNKEKTKALITRNLMDIVHFELKSKKIGMVCVNEVKVNDDSSEAKVYVTFLGAKYPHQAFTELKKTEGYVRSSLAKKMDLYKVPNVTFVYDESFERAERLEKILQKEGEQLASFEAKDEKED